jgi:hypothetical protein
LRSSVLRTGEDRVAPVDVGRCNSKRSIFAEPPLPLVQDALEALSLVEEGTLPTPSQAAVSTGDLGRKRLRRNCQFTDTIE